MNKNPDKKKNPWKIFTIIVSALLCVMIVCTFTNITINSFINSIPKNSAQIINNANANNNINNFQGNNSMGGSLGGTLDGNAGGSLGGTVDGTAGGATGGSTGGVTGGNTGGAQDANNPLSYNKAQLVDFYNAALKKSYTYRLNVSKTEEVTVKVSGVQVPGVSESFITDLTNDIVTNNTKKNGVVQTKTFVNGKATDGSTTIERFVLPTNLYADAVERIDIQSANGGYKMVITLKSETCAHNGTAKYNASCTWPLDINVIDFGQAVTINSCTFNYPGTVLTAMIDSQGRITAVKTEMPLTVKDAQAKAIGVNITVGSIEGKWNCVNQITYAG